MSIEKYETLTEGLIFPEGPVACDDGSVIVTEVPAGHLTRVMPDGRKMRLADVGGGPNGLAFGPDGALYCCNNGGLGDVVDFQGMKLPMGIPHNYKNGSIQRVNVSTGKVEVLYDCCDGVKLSAPNDIVFDKSGGFWFTDFGKDLGDRHMAGGLFYAKSDGSSIRLIAHGTSFNGVGLSPDGRTVYTGMSHQRWILAFEADPTIDPPTNTFVAPIIADFPKRCSPDSMAIEADGTIAQACVLAPSGIARVNPATGAVQMLDFGDPFSTNICFGGPEMKTAYITLSGSGRLAKVAWPAPGLRLPFNG